MFAFEENDIIFNVADINNNVYDNIFDDSYCNDAFIMDVTEGDIIDITFDDNLLDVSFGSDIHYLSSDSISYEDSVEFEGIITFDDNELSMILETSYHDLVCDNSFHFD
jgi:hypothetical protein